MNTDFIDFINQHIHRTLQNFQEPSAVSPHYTKPTFYMQDGIIHYQLQEPVKLFIQGKEGSLGYYIGTGYVPPFKHYEAFSSYFFNQPEHGEIHRHEFYECTYVLEGTYGYGIGDQIITLSQGDCILMDTNCIHWNRYGKTDMKVLYLAFQKELLEHILSLAKEPLLASHLLHGKKTKEQHFFIYPSRTLAKQQKKKELLFQMFLEQEQKERNYQQILSCLTERFLYLLEEDGTAYVLDKSTRDDQILLQIDQLIQQNLSLASPAYLQEQLHFNTAYYNRLVKKRFGITLVQYIQKKRLAKAKQLLAETNLPVGKIIEKIGYQNRYHFYTLFARETGMTPIEYRTQAFRILLSQQNK